MQLITHTAVGYLIYKIINRQHTISGVNKSWLLISAIAGALSPDLDFFFFTYVSQHHNSPFHTPLFWAVVFTLAIIVILIIKKPSAIVYLKIFLMAVLSHLFLDWEGGRSTGIMIVWPFSEKMYSLFPLQPEKGMIPTVPGWQTLAFFKFYLENKILVGMELLTIIAAVLVYIQSKRLQNTNQINKT